MRSKPIVLGVLVAAVLALAVSAFAAPGKGAALVIRHQVRGCHAWSLNGGPYVSHQTVRLSRGGSLTVTNDDFMAQELVKTGGQAVTMKLVRQSHMGSMPMGMPKGMAMGKAGPYTMWHMGAKLRVTFSRAGSYRFKLVDRGDYIEVETRGRDNELTLRVIVS